MSIEFEKERKELVEMVDTQYWNSLNELFDRVYPQLGDEVSNSDGMYDTNMIITDGIIILGENCAEVKSSSFVIAIDDEDKTRLYYNEPDFYSSLPMIKTSLVKVKKYLDRDE